MLPLQNGSYTALIKLPESFDWHCTKQDLDAFLNCVTDYCNTFYKAENCIVNLNRFGDYREKQARQFDNLHLVVNDFSNKQFSSSMFIIFRPCYPELLVHIMTISNLIVFNRDF